METLDHFVEFDKYCKTCKFRDKNDKKGEEPCNECLDNPVNQDSRKPVNYKEDPEEIKRLEKYGLLEAYMNHHHIRVIQIMNLSITKMEK